MLRVRNLRKRYTRSGAHVTGVASVSFDVPKGAFFTLLGPSGCGKTTTLRCVAGLERPTSGEIRIGERVAYSDQERVFVPVHRRQIGMVFQSYAIWPHMSVFENVAYPLEVRRWPREKIVERVRDVLQRVDLPGLEKRPAADLSGGQQQRVAVARAIVAEADLLLFDEPLSNIDAKLRVQMRDELRALQRRLGITTLYVTHDQEEALAISDQIAVMHDGVIVEMGEPADLYRSPRTRFTANFIGQSNLLKATVVEVDGVYLQAETALGRLTCVKGAAEVSNAIHLCVRPEDLEILPNCHGVPDSGNTFPGTVERVTFLGAFADCLVRTGSETLKVRVHPRSLPRTGETIRVRIPPDYCYGLAD